MISPEVEGILSNCVATHEALQTLLRLKSEPHRTWCAEDLATALNLEIDLARQTLQSLLAGGMLRTDTSAAGPGYRYAPRSHALEAVGDELQQAWREHPLEIIRVMNSNAIARTRTDAIRAFADAFILSKGCKDD